MRLFKLELKRVLTTRSTAILLLAALAFTLFMAYIPVTYVSTSYLDENGKLTKLTGLAAIRHIQESQAGISREVTPEKVRRAVETYQNCILKYGVEYSSDLPDGVYGTEIQPYIGPLIRGAREAFADPDTGMTPAIMELDPEEMERYYAACDAHIAALMQLEQPRHPAAQQTAVRLYSQVEKPFLYFPGYTSDAVDYQVLLAFLVMLMCTVIAAPIFTSDYQTGADDILRCTKHGRTKFAAVKITSALLICGTAFALCAGVYILVSDSLFGWESTRTSMQLLFSIVNLPNWNILQMQLFAAISGLLSLLATVSFTLFLSARCKNVVISLSTALVFCILPMFLDMMLPAQVCTWLNGILPAAGTGMLTSAMYSAIDFAFWNIGSIAIWLPHVMVAAYVVEIPLFIGLTMYAYTRHNAV